MSPEDIKRLPPEVQQFFSERSAGYVATADIASGKIEAAKAAAQTQREVTDPENGLIGHDPADAVLEQQEVSAQEPLVINTSIGGQEVLFGAVQRQDVEQWIKQRDSRQKLIAIDESLRSLHRICEEISHLRGWAELTKVINGLPASELADEVRWNKKKQWLDNQFAIIKNKDGDTSALESDERLQGFYLELHDLLVASQAVLLKLRQGTGDESREQDDHRKHIPFKERLTATRQLIEEWKDLVRQSGMKDEELHAAVAERLGKKAEDVLDIRAFARELRELGERHHWEGDTAKGDKSHVRIEMRHLEEIMPHARAIVAVSTGQIGVESATQKKDIQDSVVIKRVRNGEFGPVALPYELEKAIGGFNRKDKELWYRDQSGSLYRVIPTRGDEVFELWYPDGVRILGHYRELADKLGRIGVIFDSKRMRSEGEFRDPKLRLVSEDEAQNLARQADGVTLREREKAVREIEETLIEKLKVFVERMNERLLQQEPGISYAKRRGRILAQMPEFAELMLNLPQYQSVALSSAERDAMIEKNTASIQIPK